ncbi:hypothetical protein DENSPDRAFT_885442 [Dentipellis sp. KUC8613]|nr:hypothetical protein DENSPDRAFT_885442 [Dentipellis sp. KUC8613]
MSHPVTQHDVLSTPRNTLFAPRRAVSRPASPSVRPAAAPHRVAPRHALSRRSARSSCPTSPSRAPSRPPHALFCLLRRAVFAPHPAVSRPTPPRCFVLRRTVFTPRCAVFAPTPCTASPRLTRPLATARNAARSRTGDLTTSYTSASPVNPSCCAVPRCAPLATVHQVRALTHAIAAPRVFAWCSVPSHHTTPPVVDLHAPLLICMASSCSICPLATPRALSPPHGLRVSSPALSHMLSRRLSSPCAASRCPSYCLTTSYDLVGRSSCDLFPLVISRCPACPLAAPPAVLVPLRKVYLSI